VTVGLVIVSHSAALAAGVRELAVQMAPAVTMAVAGGTDDGGIGTSFDLVSAALNEADGGDGAVVLYDLGSALLTTETALEFTDSDDAARIVVVDAPLVEGAVAAAVAAQGGADLHEVARAARAAGASWAPVPASTADSRTSPAAGDRPVDARRTATVVDADGLHARPASVLAREAARRPGRVTIGRPGGEPVLMTDVLQLIALGLRRGETVEITCSGADAETAATDLATLIDSGLD
jgi:dihydroxyacetone kinase phosphotransfer subunit